MIRSFFEISIWNICFGDGIAKNLKQPHPKQCFKIGF